MSAPAPRPGRPMDGLTRRTFLTASGVVGAAALIAGAAKVTVDQVAARASEQPLPTGTPILVLLTMNGGNDWLNTVVPYADPAYQAARPGLAYTASDVIKLDDQWGLNPGLTGLATQWQAGRLAIVRGVGYPNPDRSHFRSMDIWQTASPQTPIHTGWIGRWLDGAGADPLLALSMGAVLPPLAVGERVTAGALTATATPKGGSPLRALAGTDPADGPAARLVAGSYAASGQISAALGPAASTVAKAKGTPGAPAKGGASSAAKGGELGDQLALVAACIAAGAPTRVYAVSAAGFDTHADERGTQQSLLTRVDAALQEFRTALAGTAREADVVVVAYSEFGRRVRANASQGTDHGTAGNVLVLGPKVRGGYLGDAPSLTSLVDGDLAVTTDFRSVYATVLRDVLGADPDRVLGTHADPLPLFA